jgi:competence protein ComEA
VELLPPPTPSPIVVDVAGAVPRPGVYELPGGSRVKDAIDAAGGFLAEADKSNLNLAAPLEDGQKLDIPFLAGVEPAGAVRVVVDEVAIVNINIATLEELETLPGIGPTLAQRVIDYRETFGDFYFIEDIMNVEGIGSDTFDQIASLIITGYE